MDMNAIVPGTWATEFPDPELHRIEFEKILPLFAQITSSEELLRAL